MSSAVVHGRRDETISAETNAHDWTSNQFKDTRGDDVIDVSVCIVNWNCRGMLHDCLASLRDELQGVKLEIVVADNASTDGAAEMVAEQFPDVVLIRNAQNLGFSRGNNQAAQSARGRYLFFLNNDTLVPPGTLRELLDYAEAHPEAGMIGPRLVGPDGKPQVSYREVPTLTSLLHKTSLLRWTGLLRRSYLKYRRRDFDPNHAREVAVLMGAAIFTPRIRFLDWGGWDEDFHFGGEDIEMSIRAGAHGKLIFWPEAEIVHYGRVSTRQHMPATTQIAAGLVRFLRKSGTGDVGILIYKTVVTADAPVRLAGKSAEFLIRKMCGRKRKAQKSLLSLRVAWHFLTSGLVEFWRA